MVASQTKKFPAPRDLTLCVRYVENATDPPKIASRRCSTARSRRRCIASYTAYSRHLGALGARSLEPESGEQAEVGPSSKKVCGIFSSRALIGAERPCLAPPHKLAHPIQPFFVKASSSARICSTSSRCTFTIIVVLHCCVRAGARSMQYAGCVCTRFQWIQNSIVAFFFFSCMNESLLRSMHL